MMLSRPMGRQQLFLALRENIERGRYAPGSWLPAERALAQEFDVDRSAIRRVLMQLESQGLIVREAGKRPWVRGVQSVHTLPAMETGSTGAGQPPKASPTMLKSGLRTIVAILPQHPVFPASLAILHGINAALRSTEAPFRLQILDTHGGSDGQETALEKQALDSVIRESIAGVVLWHMGGAATLPQLQELESRGTPVVFVDRYPASLACDFVGSDNQAGVEAAIEHLWQLGHRRIAYLTVDEQTTAVAARFRAYKEAMAAAGIVPRTDWIFQASQNCAADVASAYTQFFALSEPPTAVLAMNDSLAYRFLTECQKRGTRVPEDISVVGFDDLERHSPRAALLTTLHQPFDKMGRRAAEILLRRLAGPETQREPRQHVLMPTPLVKRLTCGPLLPETLL